MIKRKTKNYSKKWNQIPRSSSKRKKEWKIIFIAHVNPNGIFLFFFKQMIIEASIYKLRKVYEIEMMIKAEELN